MRKLVVIVSLIVVVLLSFVVLRFLKNNEGINNSPLHNTKTLNLSSSAFENNQYIPKKYTCDGDNISPPLAISGVPQNTESLALTMDDPDAPSGTFVHWILYNINPGEKSIEENSHKRYDTFCAYCETTNTQNAEKVGSRLDEVTNGTLVKVEPITRSTVYAEYTKRTYVLQTVQAGQ